MNLSTIKLTWNRVLLVFRLTSILTVENVVGRRDHICRGGLVNVRSVRGREWTTEKYIILGWDSKFYKIIPSMGLHIHFSGGSSPRFPVSGLSRLHMYELLLDSVGHASANRAFCPSFFLPVLYPVYAARDRTNNRGWPEKSRVNRMISTLRLPSFLPCASCITTLDFGWLRALVISCECTPKLKKAFGARCFSYCITFFSVRIFYCLVTGLRIFYLCEENERGVIYIVICFA